MSTSMTERASAQGVRRSVRAGVQLGGATQASRKGSVRSSRGKRVSSLPARVGASVALLVLAGVVVWAAPALRVVEAQVCAVLMRVFTEDASSVTVHGVPGIAYQLNGSWLALPVTAQLTGVFAVAGLLVIAAAAVWLPQLTLFRSVSLVRVLLAAGVALLGTVIVFLIRMMVLASLWASGGIVALQGAAVWLTVVAYTVAGFVALAGYFFFVVRPALRGTAGGR